MKIAVCTLVAALVLATSITVGAQTPPARIVVHDETQLPRFAYPLKMAPSELLLADDATFAPFAATVGADVDKTLQDYDIQDLSTLREVLQTKLALQMLAGDADGARATIATIRADQPKADLKLLTDRLYLLQLDSRNGANATDLDRTFIDALPFDVVADSVKQSYGSEQSVTQDVVVGFIQHDLDPIYQRTGTLDGPAAGELVQLRAQLRFALPLYAVDVGVLHAYIAQHNVVKPDIWAARDVRLTPAQVVRPVVVGIWDSGVDLIDYPANVYVDRAGKHGLALADDGSPSPKYTYTLPPTTAAKYASEVKLLDGQADAQSAIDSPAADAYRHFLRALSPAQAAGFSFDMDWISEYAHGSHVAGIAVRGNPGAKIAVARFDDNLPNLSFAPSDAWLKRMAAGFAATAAYFRANHVRVVNMSWSDNVSEFEEWLAKTDPVSDPKTREARAQALYADWRQAIERVIAGTPGTLFVGAAGNGDNDATFAGEVPASLSFPNMITVGATDQAGDATTFTSYGPTVAVYADGFHVPSKIPGGYTVKFSGTSMASPAVTNLAAKLFALDPALTPVQARALIVSGATLSSDGKRKLIDPQRSVALLKKTQK